MARGSTYLTWGLGILVLLVVIGFGLLLLFGPRFEIGVTLTETQAKDAAEYQKTLAAATAAPLNYYDKSENSTCVYHDDGAYVWGSGDSVIPAPVCMAENHYVTSTITRKCVEIGCTFQDGTPMEIGESETRVVAGCEDPVAPCQKVSLIAVYETQDGATSWVALTTANARDGITLSGSYISQVPSYEWYAVSGKGGWVFYNVATDRDARYIVRRENPETVEIQDYPYGWYWPAEPTGPANIRSVTIDRYMKFPYMDPITIVLTGYPVKIDQLVVVSEDGFENFVLDFAANFGTGGSQRLMPFYLEAKNATSGDPNRTVDDLLRNISE